jgi:hypothetical protein
MKFHVLLCAYMIVCGLVCACVDFALTYAFVRVRRAYAYVHVRLRCVICCAL